MTATCSGVRWALCGLVVLGGCGGGTGGATVADKDLAKQSKDSLQKLALAIHRHESEQRHFPPAYTTDASGKPLLSWRVALLPMLGEGALYAKFDQSKSWDSPENLALVKQMPTFFRSPYAEKAAADGKTTYLAARGPRSAMSSGARVDMGALFDGSSTVLMLVEVAPEYAVEWTKPADWETEPDLNVKQLQTAEGNKFLGAFADAHVQTVPRDFPVDSIRLLIDYRDGKPVFLPPPE